MDNFNKPVWERRRTMRIVLITVCCIALVIASGFAGAKINEWRLGALQSGSEAARASETASGDRASETAGGNQAGDQYSDAGTSDPIEGDRAYVPDGDDDTEAGGKSGVNPLGSVNPDGGTLSLTELFAGANPAVVAISTEMTGRNAFGSIVTQPAAGSGFIISADGYIVTNNHVIDGATSISVLMHDGVKYPAELVGRDPSSDLAVLKIEAGNLSYLTLGNSDKLQVGEQVAAIGNPLGEFANSMTVGYISALDREINIDGTARIMLQTDAAVNSGNSGGPLLDMKGRVIGIVTAKSSGSNVEGLGFAIPSSKAEAAINQLINLGNTEGFGYVKKQAVMGVVVSSREDSSEPGVLVQSVNSGSAAEKAGILEGDVILSANGTVTGTVVGLKEVINALFPGDKLSLNILRDGKEIVINVTLDEYVPSNDEGSESYGWQTPYYPDDDSEFPFDPWSMFPDMNEFFHPEEG